MTDYLTVEIKKLEKEIDELRSIDLDNLRNESAVAYFDVGEYIENINNSLREKEKTLAELYKERENRWDSRDIELGPRLRRPRELTSDYNEYPSRRRRRGGKRSRRKNSMKKAKRKSSKKYRK
jgi:hypothetical protein